jgi:NTP pyrophosphatase (non-canonical NTP hydrolase)
MTLNEYQKQALETSTYGAGYKIIYPALGLTGEAGEVSDKIKKVLRDKDGVFCEEIKLEIMKEVMDVLWYIAALSNDLGYTLEEGAQMNLDKLASRKARGVIGGSGDNR